MASRSLAIENCMRCPDHKHNLADGVLTYWCDHDHIDQPKRIVNFPKIPGWCPREKL